MKQISSQYFSPYSLMFEMTNVNGNHFECIIVLQKFSG